MWVAYTGAVTERQSVRVKRRVTKPVYKIRLRKPPASLQKPTSSHSKTTRASIERLRTFKLAFILLGVMEPWRRTISVLIPIEALIEKNTLIQVRGLCLTEAWLRVGVRHPNRGQRGT